MSYTGLVQPTAMTSLAEVIDDTTPLINKVYSSDKVQSEIDTLEAEVTPVSLLEKVKTVDGLGSGLDADLLRGLPADFGSSLAANGWQKLPSGLIIQAGSFNKTVTGSVTVALPATFPNVCMAVLTTPRFTGTIANMWKVESMGLSSFVISGQNAAAEYYENWLAIGY